MNARARLAIACALVVLAACGGRHERVAVIGMVVPLPADAAPPAGESRRPLPPMEDVAVEPDTREGAVLVTVDRREFWREHGHDFPAWSPRAAPPARPDPGLERLRRLRQAMDGVRAALAAMPVTDAAGRPLLSADEWSALTARILVLGERVDAAVAAAREPVPGGDADPLDGDATLRRLGEATWHGMDDAAVAAVATTQALDDGGAFAALVADPTRGAEAMRLMDAAVAAVRALAVAVETRDAPRILARVRLARAALGDLEASPIAAAAFGRAVGGPQPDIARADRERSRAALAAAHQRLASLGAQWLANQARLIEPQPRPTLVYRPAATMD
ncbi:MAG TPA: hypothetical protein VEL07_22330 [Planctomycetota bacterium]|nr:hypothetical protein [Planctomycetota bacterium]